MTTLDPQFLRAIVLLCGFKPEKMKRAQAALLLIGLRAQEFTAAELPGEITEGSKHIAGAATGALVAEGLLEVIGRVKSPRPDAKGRKLDVLRIPREKWNTVKTWLRINGIQETLQEQAELL
jgi:hypothetical protein